RNLEDAIARKRAVTERVGRVTGLLQVALVELVGVQDEDAARLQVPDVDFERRGVHRHQNLRLVARRADVAAAEIELIAGDARQAARRGANLGREIRQRRYVIADDCGGGGELASRHLHAVAGIPGETDGDGLKLFYRKFSVCNWVF